MEVHRVTMKFMILDPQNPWKKKEKKKEKEKKKKKESYNEVYEISKKKFLRILNRVQTSFGKES